MQLTLGVSLKDEATFDNFYNGSNAEIVQALIGSVTKQGENIIYLYGMKGEGCSHLLQACCHKAHQQEKTSVYIPLLQHEELSTEMLTGLENMDLVCIDDIHAIAGNLAWEEALFHLFNRLYDANRSIIITGEHLPRALKLKLNDLTSRLSWGIVFQLQPLSDEEKLIALMMRAKRRGMHLSEDVGKYILTHCDRHMRALFHVLDTLDKASLTAQRRLTIPFVKAVLQL